MSERIIVATFDSNNAAYDTVSEVNRLREDKTIEFKPTAGAMVAKDENGNVSLMEIKERPPWATAVGTTTGALIGLIGGAPGAALGAALGAMAGVSGDVVMSALDSDFVRSVTLEMHPNTTAIVVEANEMSTEPLDMIVKRHGGHVYRQEVH